MNNKTERQKLEEDVAIFLKLGGQIRHIESGVSGYEAISDKTRKARHRAETDPEKERKREEKKERDATQHKKRLAALRKAVREKRIRLGLSHADAAAMIGMSARYLQKIEAGENVGAQSSTLPKIEKWLKTKEYYNGATYDTPTDSNDPALPRVPLPTRRRRRTGGRLG